MRGAKRAAHAVAALRLREDGARLLEEELLKLLLRGARGEQKLNWRSLHLRARSRVLTGGGGGGGVAGEKAKASARGGERLQEKAEGE